MKDPYTINLQEGQSVIVYHNNKVLIKKTYSECRSIFTAWDSFVGTASEVEAEISRLGLIEVKSPKPTIPTISKRPTEPATGSYAVAPEPAPAVSVVARATSAVVNTVTNTVSTVWNTVTSIFSDKQQ
ncbi:hypothetical protein UFOVP157_8 [uncultured Caudovirales phage]|uniref:Uncharacterized protein n=1 Tax=uncultured Caudovirales phage TaxID=2100421 RepID=A0A6J7W904_9CAUD|nr:hypothetical protein UFOVP157_8 [uncultured Caudovirales phage]